MENILNNKRFITASIVLVALLSLFVLAKLVNEVKMGKYIGRSEQVPASITVSGSGEVMAVSDIATISVNLTKDGKTSKEAQDLLNTEITKVVKYLKDQKIDDKDIKSEYGGLNPKYSYEQIYCVTYPCPQKDPKITGYTATQSITIKVREVDNANEVRTGLATLGIIDISGPSFSIDDEDGLTAQAREKAIDDAKEKAKVLAKQLGVSLGGIVSFSENGGGYPMMYAKDMRMESMAVGSAPAPELPKGENKITSNVTITYDIK